MRKKTSSHAMEEDDDGEESGVRVLWVLVQHDGFASEFTGGGDGGGFFFLFFFFFFSAVVCGDERMWWLWMDVDVGGCGGFFLL